MPQLPACTCSRSTSSDSFMFFVCIRKISRRPVASGIPMSTSLSKRPERESTLCINKHWWSQYNKKKIQFRSNRIAVKLDQHCLVCWLRPSQWHGTSALNHPSESKVATQFVFPPLHESVTFINKLDFTSILIYRNRAPFWCNILFYENCKHWDLAVSHE